ncbi:MAG: glycosyltransferase family 39 protein [Microthrixaceae bacterium]|nr:glycosyltransferase family 39 protein [Microthrixaceae bacterium]
MGEPRRTWQWWTFVVVLVVVVGLGVVARFVTRSPLWMDEALSVNIAGLPAGQIPDALRHDGHPPLYYLLLHGWIRLFGSADHVTRALSGLWSVALLVLMYVAGRRLGGRRVALTSVVLLAVSPFAIRYATEARMYAMVSTLALAAWLFAEASWKRRRPAPLIGLAVCTSLLLWTHYWVIWLVLSACVIVAVIAFSSWRAGGTETKAAALGVMAALTVGAVSFLPWVPTLVFQARHTATPWARASRPAEVISTSASDFGGGVTGEAELLGWLFLVLVAIGAWAYSQRNWELSVDLRRPNSEQHLVLAALVGGTVIIGVGASLVFGTAYSSRYAAVVFPFMVLLAGATCAHLQPRALVVTVLSVMTALGGVGIVRNVTVDRSDARRNAEAIARVASPADIIVYCPDQTAPATAHELGNRWEQVTFPTFASPQFVDWVDYLDRSTSVTPQRFTRDLLERAEGRSIFLVYSVAVHSHREICPAVAEELGRARPAEVIATASQAFEPSGVVRFAPAGQ